MKLWSAAVAARTLGFCACVVFALKYLLMPLFILVCFS